MAGHLRLGHREAHACEEPALAAVADVALRFLVRLHRRGAHDVDPDLAGRAFELSLGHDAEVSSENAPVRMGP